MKIPALIALAALLGGAPATAAADVAEDVARVTVKTEGIEDALEKGGFKGLKLSGYMDPAFVYNRNLRRDGFQFVIPTATEGYTYYASNFGTVSLDVQKEMEGGTKWRLTLMPARSTSDVFSGLGIVHEASVSVPLTNAQTRLIAGQIPDWSGYEYLPAPQNRLITHNLLFDFTLPISYTGVGIELSSSQGVFKAVVGNMSASVRPEGEQVPVVAYRLDWYASEYAGLGFAGTHGRTWNLAGTRDSWVNVFEVDGYYTRGPLNLNFQVGVGAQDEASVTPDPATGELRRAQWAGASVLGAYKFTPRVEGVVRADYLFNGKAGGGLLTYPFADGRNGIGPAYGGDPARSDPEKGADRYAVSVGMSYLFNANVTFKAEARLDGATEPVFAEYPVTDDPTVDGYVKTNQVYATSVVVAF